MMVASSSDTAEGRIVALRRGPDLRSDLEIRRARGAAGRHGRLVPPLAPQSSRLAVCTKLGSRGPSLALSVTPRTPVVDGKCMRQHQPAAGRPEILPTARSDAFVTQPRETSTAGYWATRSLVPGCRTLWTLAAMRLQVAQSGEVSPAANER